MAGGAGPVPPESESGPGGGPAARQRDPGLRAGRSAADVVAEIPVDPAVARAVDAGLLLASLHRLGAFRALARMVDPGSAPAAGPARPLPTDPTDLTPLAATTPLPMPSLPIEGSGMAVTEWSARSVVRLAGPGVPAAAPSATGRW